MDKETFNNIIARYLDIFDLTNSNPHDEGFKWAAIDCFQKNWDLDAPDFVKMFGKSVKQFDVLIDNIHATPISAIKTLLNQEGESEIVREAFRELYSDDSGDISLRQKKATDFVETINKRIEKYWPGSHKYPQSIRSAVLFLTMRYPADNYILFWSRAYNWANYTEFGNDFSSGASFSLPIFYQMCDELREEILKRPELQHCNEKRQEASHVKLEDDYHTLVYDIIYCATCYNLYKDIPHYGGSAAKRIERSKERTQLEELKKKKESADKELNAFDIMSRLPPDLIGHTVQHKKYGEGCIVSRDEKNHLFIRFGNTEKEFSYPDAFLQKHLVLANDGDQEAVMKSCECSERFSAIEKEASSATAAYEKAKAAFNQKWIKTISNDDVNTEEE